MATLDHSPTALPAATKSGKPREHGNGHGSVFNVAHRGLPWCASVVIGWTPSGRPVRRVRYASSRAEAERLRALMARGVMPPRALERKLAPETKRLGKRNRHTTDVPYRMRFLVLERDGFCCAYCGRRPPEVALEIDHIVPRSKGGATDPANLKTACHDCNVGKGSNDLA